MTQHDNEQIIRDFCDGWEAGDADALVDAFTEDAVYHNIPMDPSRVVRQSRPSSEDSSEGPRSPFTTTGKSPTATL